MSISIITNYTDTLIDGVSSEVFNRANLNYKADFVQHSQSAPGRTILINRTAPGYGVEEKIRIESTSIQNIYQNTGIEKAFQSPTSAGTSMLVQVTDILTVKDSTDPNFRIDLPISAHLVVKVPKSEYLDAAKVQTLIGRVLAALYDTGDTSTSRLDGMLRGALTPPLA